MCANGFKCDMVRTVWYGMREGTIVSYENGDNFSHRCSIAAYDARRVPQGCIPLNPTPDDISDPIDWEGEVIIARKIIFVPKDKITMGCKSGNPDFLSNHVVILETAESR